MSTSTGGNIARTAQALGAELLAEIDALENADTAVDEVEVAPEPARSKVR